MEAPTRRRGGHRHDRVAGEVWGSGRRGPFEGLRACWPDTVTRPDTSSSSRPFDLPSHVAAISLQPPAAAAAAAAAPAASSARPSTAARAVRPPALFTVPPRAPGRKYVPPFDAPPRCVRSALVVTPRAPAVRARARRSRRPACRRTMRARWGRKWFNVVKGFGLSRWTATRRTSSSTSRTSTRRVPQPRRGRARRVQTGGRPEHG